MGRFNYYAIVNGKDGFKGTKETWEECAPLVKGVEGARYKGFSRLEDAEEWIEYAYCIVSREALQEPHPGSAPRTAETGGRREDHQGQAARRGLLRHAVLLQ